MSPIRFAAPLFLVFSACAPAPARTPCPPPPSAVPPVTPPTPAPPLTDADVVRWSHSALEAWDRADAAALGAQLSTGYMHLEGGSTLTRDAELAALARRKPGAGPIALRAWSNERVAVHEPYAIFNGEAKERSAGNDAHGGNVYDGWYSLVWCREGTAWKLALWTWRQGGLEAKRTMWNATFHDGTGFNKEPNGLLVGAIAKVKPGAALDIATGQGRNAIYLASHGWRVTGVDIADEGLRVARDAATAKHLALETVNADLEAYDFGTSKWDLVTMIYALANVGWVERAKKSVKPGGLFVLEDFARDDADPNDDGFAAGQLSAMFKDGFDIVRDEVLEATPDWAADRAKIVRFVAKRR